MNIQKYVLQTGPGRKSSGNAARIPQKIPRDKPGGSKTLSGSCKDHCLCFYFRNAVPVLIRLFSFCL